MDIIFTSKEELEAVVLTAIQKANTEQKPVKEEHPENIGAPEAKKLLSEIWGCPVSDSLFYKMSCRKELPSSHVGKRLTFNRDELVKYAESKINKPFDSILDSVTRAARRRIQL